MQVVAKPHQRAYTTQQEACLLCVSITSDCILKLKHQKRFTSCLKIHINAATCFGFYSSQRGVHCCQFHYMAREGISLPEGLIVRDKSVLAANQFCREKKSLLSLFFFQIGNLEVQRQEERKWVVTWQHRRH